MTIMHGEFLINKMSTTQNFDFEGRILESKYHFTYKVLSLFSSKATQKNSSITSGMVIDPKQKKFSTPSLGCTSKSNCCAAYCKNIVHSVLYLKHEKNRNSSTIVRCWLDCSCKTSDLFCSTVPEPAAPERTTFGIKQLLLQIFLISNPLCCNPLFPFDHRAASMKRCLQIVPQETPCLITSKKWQRKRTEMTIPSFK